MFRCPGLPGFPLITVGLPETYLLTTYYCETISCPRVFLSSIFVYQSLGTRVITYLHARRPHRPRVFPDHLITHE